MGTSIPPDISFTILWIKLITSDACFGDAESPVPIAQIGSYARRRFSHLLSQIKNLLIVY